MAPDVVERAEKALGYQFRDQQLLSSALTHASASDGRLSSNERLEFLGDAILDLVVCEELYKTYPKYLEGELTKIKSVVVSRRTCARVARRLDLTSLLRVGKGMTGREQLPGSLAAAVVESCIAAIYLDGGIEPARRFILETMGSHIDKAANSHHHHNYKSQLQQYAQRHMNATPAYEILDEQGPDHSKCFEVAVSIRGRRFPSAWGPSKKHAEQLAALRALENLDLQFDQPHEEERHEEEE